MKVSVITVSKNAVNDIENTIKSILSQTYKDIEFIVIDGDSNDGTKELLNKYKNKISYFISETDNGIYQAMNKGIKASTGDILFFLNAQDSFYDEMVIEKAVNFFRKNPCDIIYGKVYHYKKGEETNGKIMSFQSVNSYFKFVDHNINHQSIFYRKSLFNKYGLYDESFKILGDYDFNARVLVKNKCKAKFFNEVICRFQLGGLSSKINNELKESYRVEHEILLNRNFNEKIIKDFNFVYKDIYYIMNKYFRTLLRLYDNNESIRNFIDNLVGIIYGYKFS